MSFQVAGFQTEGYHVDTAAYEGPLDILLELIERAELDITKLALAQVTNQYLAYLETFQERDPAEISAFLVIAARLLQIKSSALLPRPPRYDSDEEEDPGEMLARQLIQYKRFKDISKLLKQRGVSGFRSYLRIAPPTNINYKYDMSGVTLDDLVLAASKALNVKAAMPFLNQVVNMPRVTVKDRIHAILDMLKGIPKVSFKELLDNETRMEIVVSFLALLELVKRRIVEVQQADVFGDIMIEKVGEWQELNAVDLEFID